MYSSFFHSDLNKINLFSGGFQNFIKWNIMHNVMSWDILDYVVKWIVPEWEGLLMKVNTAKFSLLNR